MEKVKPRCKEIIAEPKWEMRNWTEPWLPEMVGRGWVDKDLGGRIDRTWDQNDARTKGSCRSKLPPRCLLE